MSKVKTFGFSVLSNDVDMDNFIIHRPVREKKPEPEPVKKVVSKPKEKTVKKKQELQSLQALAFGNPSTKGKKKQQSTVTNGVSAGLTAKGSNAAPPAAAATAKKNKKNADVSSEAAKQDKPKTLSDDWKNRDQQYIEDENERELREALLLSKLDYEANKGTYQQSKENSNKNNTKAKKKKDKPITVSLSEFNTMDTRKLSSVNGTDSSIKASRAAAAAAATDNSRDNNFFNDVDVAVRNTIVKETRQKQYNEMREKQQSKSSPSSSGPPHGGGSRRSPSDTSGPRLVPVTEVEKRDFEIQALRLEVESLKDQLEKVKLRNKKLCEVLGTAEMRSIGEVVIELSKVTKARDELSTEVATLSGQLEQEKTKVSLLQDKHRKK